MALPHLAAPKTPFTPGINIRSGHRSYFNTIPQQPNTQALCVVLSALEEREPGALPPNINSLVLNGSR